MSPCRTRAEEEETRGRGKGGDGRLVSDRLGGTGWLGRLKGANARNRTFPPLGTGRHGTIGWAGLVSEPLQMFPDAAMTNFEWGRCNAPCFSGRRQTGDTAPARPCRNGPGERGAIFAHDACCGEGKTPPPCSYSPRFSYRLMRLSPLPAQPAKPKRLCNGFQNYTKIAFPALQSGVPRTMGKNLSI